MSGKRKGADKIAVQAEVRWRLYCGRKASSDSVSGRLTGEGGAEGKDEIVDDLKRSSHALDLA